MAGMFFTARCSYQGSQCEPQDAEKTCLDGIAGINPTLCWACHHRHAWTDIPGHGTTLCPNWF